MQLLLGRPSGLLFYLRYNFNMPWEILKWIGLVIVIVFAGTALTGAPFVPSRRKELDIIFKKLYKLSKKDLLVDLGSGDGKVLKAASDFGARALGIELNPFLAIFSKIRFISNPRVSTKMSDFFHGDLPLDTTVVYVFGDGRDMKRIAKKVEEQAQKMKHPVYLISHAFEIPGHKIQKRCRAYMLYKINP